MTDGSRPSDATDAPLPAPPPPRPERIPMAIMLMVSAGAIFAISSAASKWLVATYPPGEVLFSRVAISLLLFACFALPKDGLGVLRTTKHKAHAIRGVSQFTSQSLLLIAFSMMPLAPATAINFSAPLFATLASMIFLKETVGRARWAALLVGFVGVLIVTNPGSETFQIGSLYALGNALLFGTVTAGVRGMSATESARTLTIYQLMYLTLLYGMTLPFWFVTPRWEDMPLVLLNGACNMLGQYWWTRSIQLAPTSAVVPFQYLSLIWAILLGFAIWGDVPTVALLIGSAIVIASGLFLLLHESRRSRVPAPPPKPGPP